MSPSPFVPERRIEYWTSRQVEQFFVDAGFECITFPISPHAERYIPADHLFQPRSNLKLFGLQYKALYNGATEHWRLDHRQHATLRYFPWIYYGLSDIRDPQDSRNCLHALRLKTSAFPFQDQITPGEALPYRRWWSFYAELERCNTGVRLTAPNVLVDYLVPALGTAVAAREVGQIIDVFLVETEARRAVHLSPPELLGREF